MLASQLNLNAKRMNYVIFLNFRMLCIRIVLCWNCFNFRDATITRKDSEGRVQNKRYSVMSILMQNSCFRLVRLSSLMPMQCQWMWCKISFSHIMHLSVYVALPSGGFSRFYQIYNNHDKISKKGESIFFLPFNNFCKGLYLFTVCLYFQSIVDIIQKQN